MHPARGPAFASLRRAWYNDEIDTATYFQHLNSGEESIAAALERLQIGTDSIQNESRNDADDRPATRLGNQSVSSIDRSDRSVSVTLRRALYYGDIDNETFDRLRNEGESTIVAVLQSRGTMIDRFNRSVESRNSDSTGTTPLLWTRPGPALSRLRRAYINNEIDRHTFARLELLSEERISAALQTRGLAIDSVPVARETQEASVPASIYDTSLIAKMREENEQRSTRLVSRYCGVCLTEAPLRRAVLVLCGHALCLACAAEMRNGEGTRIVCPFCRERSAFVPLIEEHIDE